MSRVTTEEPVITVEETAQSGGTGGETDVQTDVRGNSQTGAARLLESRYSGLRPWKKGHSGNPGGLSVEAKQWYQTLKSELPERFAGIRELTKCADPRVALQAHTYLVDRVLGRPTERVEDARPPLRTVWIGPYGAGGPVIAVVEERPALPSGEDLNGPSGGNAPLDDEGTS